jgi:hypothetical protein
VKSGNLPFPATAHAACCKIHHLDSESSKVGWLLRQNPQEGIGSVGCSSSVVTSQAPPGGENWIVEEYARTDRAQQLLKLVSETTMKLAAAVVTLFLCGVLAQAQPSVSISPTSLPFGMQTIGTISAPLTATLTNTGTSSLTISKTAMQGSALDFSQSNNCGTSVPAGSSCTFTVTFSPTYAVTRTATITISDNAAGSPHKISLSGTGALSVVKINPINLVFSKQAVGTTSGVKTVKLTNNGTVPLNITSIVASAEFAQTNTCGTSVAAGATCVISVTFTPAAIWTRSGYITINDSVPDTPQLIPVAGMGTGNAVGSLSATSLTFASQTVGSSSSAQTVTLTNTGTDILTINSIVTSGDYSQTTTCGTTLAAGSNCSVSVTFTPSLDGTRSGFITLNVTDSVILRTVTLNGTGTDSDTTVAITPRTASVTPTQVQQFNATISGTGTSDVDWAVDGIAGGNSSVGTISSSGLYTPPAAGGVHQISANSHEDPSQTATVPLTVSTFAGTLTYKNDNQRTGQNLTEPVLTTGNVNPNQFGKLFSYPVDGYVFAQPLYVPSVNIPNLGVHNVVYVATEHDSVYAFDADNLTPTPLWQTSFINPTVGVTTVPKADVEGPGSDITPEIGITPTPVIDLTRNAIYVLARTKEVSGATTSYVQRLHALDLTTGAELANSPVVISAQVNGTGSGNDNHGHINFDGKQQNGRPGLLLLNGVVYLCWASLGDRMPFHGWVLGYDGGSLQQVAVFNTTPNGIDGGIWQSGGAPAADPSGNIFLIVGNGTFDAFAGGIDYGDSVLRLTNSGSGLSVGDYFAPYNQVSLDNADNDLGSGGPLLLPDQPGSFPHLAVVAGKDGSLYLVNRDNMGQFSSTTNNVPLYVPAAVGKAAPGSAGNRGTPAYWQGQVYFTGSVDFLKAFGLYNGLLSAMPLSTGSVKFNYPGAEAAISANRNANGIVWVLQADKFLTGPVVLRAYDAVNVSRELFNSATLPANTAGFAVKFSVPTVANAKVYVGTQTELDVYGLLP